MLPNKSPAGSASSDFGWQWKYSAELFSVAIIYFGAAKLSLILASIHPSATPIWPPSGLAFAVVLLLGYRIWPAIFLAALIANLTTAGSLYTSLAIAAGNTLESLVGAYLVNRWSDGCRTFGTPAGVARFALICFVPSTMISATVGVGSLSVAGFADWQHFVSIWMTWWMGDLAGALVIAPVIVLWNTSSPRSLEYRRLLQSGSVFVAAIVVGFIAFSPLLEQTANRGPLAFLAIVPLMSAALWLGQRDTATAALILSCFAVWGTMANGGPFARGSLNDSFLLLLTFMISISVPSLALSAEVAMRRFREKHIEMVMLELSHRSKNLLSVVQGMARQVARQTGDFDEFESSFCTRLRALADTHDLLVSGEWHGADMRDLVRTHLAPFRKPEESGVTFEGPDLKLNPKAAEQIGLALHELGTNAAKHGAFSVTAGRVNIQWAIENGGSDEGHLRMSWKEIGGPAVNEPARKGFGQSVVTKIVPASLQGSASLEFQTDGVSWMLVVPVTSILITGEEPLAVTAA